MSMLGACAGSGTSIACYVMGGLGTRKNAPTALRAFAEVVRRGAGGNTTREIGGCEPAWRRAELRQLAE
ncbi:MAG: hypothetical protein ABJD07_13925 [Gemmatimonadaceae bacterium]